MPVNHARSRTEIKRCFPIMVQLRPDLTEPEFIERVTRQSDQYGYRLVYLEEAGQIRAVAGLIIREMLPLGRFLYVDDIVTDAAERSNRLTFLTRCATFTTKSRRFTDDNGKR